MPTLRRAVDDAFTLTGASTPPWPDPHEGHREPAPEEYSRCLDPGKYRIVRARADAWARALTTAGLATVEEADRAEAWRAHQDRAPARARWWRPTRPGALPLLIGSQPIDGVDDAVVVVGVGDPAVLVEALPDCGCDACDDGSEPLLAQLDELVEAVVAGDFVHLSSRAGTLTSVGTSRSATGRLARRRDWRRLLDRARTGAVRGEALTGRAWF